MCVCDVTEVSITSSNTGRMHVNAFEVKLSLGVENQWKPRLRPYQAGMMQAYEVTTQTNCLPNGGTIHAGVPKVCAL